MKQHPSGKPQREQRRGTATYTRSPREGYLIERLNVQRREGGFGFQMPPDDDQGLYLTTWARRRG